jgi:hypothetical protein
VERQVSASVRLTEQQQHLVEASASARILVTAPAGSGKTLSLIHRLAHLVDEEGLAPSEILVLSFTQAAVREVRRRLSVTGGDAAHVEVRTFDSYATWLLSEVAPDGPWQREGYDLRIRAAVHLIRQNSTAKELTAEVRHLIVDEVQDLVGDRAELVRALLEGDLDGFTLLGDPAQGIYGFQLDDPGERLEGAARLYAQVRRRFQSDLFELTLAGNFRARDADARRALTFGESLGDVDAPFGDLQRELRTLLLSGDSLGTLDQAAPIMARMTASTAVLCRTNQEVLLVSRRLHELDVPHRVRRGVKSGIPAWVSALYRELGSKQPSRTAVVNLLGTIAGVDPEACWDLLRRLSGGRRGDTLDLLAVRTRLGRGVVFDEVSDQLAKLTEPPLVVSTIHQAKGLEFEQVVIVDSGDATEDNPVEQADRARLLYVAMTRARDLVIHLKPIKGLSPGRLIEQRDGRLAEVGFQKGRHFGLEIRVDDIVGAEPAGTVGFAADPSDIQRYLASDVHMGDPVTLTLLPEPAAEGFSRYVVQHAGREIGVTSESLAAALTSLLPGRERRYPVRVQGLRADGVETVLGRESSGINAGLGWSGVWLRPRITGLGRFDWTKEHQ